MNTFFKKLQEVGAYKKIPIYAATVWAFIEVIDYFTHRYEWPEYIVDVSVVILVSVIPIVIIRLVFKAIGKWRWAEFLFQGLTVLMAGVFVFHFLTRPETKSKSEIALTENPTILVTPYQNVGDSLRDSYFTDGITSSVITELTKINQLSVLSESVSFKYKKETVDVAKLAEAGITYILQGKVQRAGKTIRVNSQLTNLSNNVQIWAGQLEGELTDIFSLQDKISHHIADALKIKLSSSEEKRMGSNITSNLEAYDYYLKGKYRINSVKQDDIDSAIHYFLAATKLDNNFAKAHAELSLAYTKRNHFITETKVNYIEKAYVEGEKALALDSTLAEVYYARAYESWTPQNKFPHEQVIRQLRKALVINPKYDDALNLLAKVFMHVGLLDKAKEALNQAAKVNPLNAYVLADISSYFFFKGDYPNVIKAFANVPKSYAEDPYWATEYYVALWSTGKRDAANKLLTENIKEKPNDLLYKIIHVVFLAEAGQKKEAQKILDELENFPNKESQALTFHHVTYFMGVAYAILGNNTKAIEWLRWTATNGFPSYVFFNSDPHLSGLKNDKRFTDLLEELKIQTLRFEQL